MPPDPDRPGNAADSLADRFESLLDAALALMLFVMAVSVVWQVLGRYLFDRAPSWSEEVARYLMVWVTMVGSAALLRRDGHIGVSVLVDATPARLRPPLLAVRDLFLFGSIALLGWYGWDFAQLNSFQDSAALEIPMSWTYAALWLGPLLMLIMGLLTRLGRHTALDEAGQGGDDWS